MIRVAAGLLWALCPARPAAAHSYNAYNSAVTGTSRDVGLAGSDVALPTGYAATFINPAGLGSRVTTSDVDFGSDSNVTDDFIVDINDPSQRRFDEPTKYSYSGLRYIAKDGWGLGAVFAKPLDRSESFADLTSNRSVSGFTPFSDSDQVGLLSRSYILAAGRNALDGRLSFGAALNINRIEESFDFVSTDPSTPTAHVSATKQTWSIDAGLIGRPWRWLQLGLVYHSHFHAPFDRSINNQLPAGLRWFREVKSPDVLSLGSVWFVRDWARLFAQSNYVHGIRDMVVPGSALFRSAVSARIADTQQDTFDFHWGGELIPIDEPDLTIKLWIGGYMENTGIAGGYYRYHNTAGIQLSPWLVDFSMAVDDASLYKNFTVGAGVDLLQVSHRVANYFGWKAPL